MSDTPIIPTTEEEWKQKLTPEQYRILREKGTEAPFTGQYYDSHDQGMDKCAACGQELCSSETKFESTSLNRIISINTEIWSYLKSFISFESCK